MKLEDCSQNELIHFLEKQVFIDMDKLEFEVLMYRSKILEQKMCDEGNKACDALCKYTSLLSKYEGKKYSEIPEEVITKADKAMKNFCKHTECESKYDKQYRAIHKKIDKFLNGERKVKV